MGCSMSITSPAHKKASGAETAFKLKASTRLAGDIEFLICGDWLMPGGASAIGKTVDFVLEFELFPFQFGDFPVA